MSSATVFVILRCLGLLRRLHFALERGDDVLGCHMMDDAASAACETEFAGDLEGMTEEMSARLEGITPLNLSQKLVNAEAPNGSDTLDPAMVRLRAWVQRILAQKKLPLTLRSSLLMPMDA